MFIILLLVLSGAVAFLFRSDLQNIFGLGINTNNFKKDFRGENITFNAGNKTITIPPSFSGSALSYLKQQLTENAGLPLKIERKGNPLPFGIP